MLHKPIIKCVSSNIIIKWRNLRLKSITQQIGPLIWAVYCARLINRGNISIWFDPTTECYAQSQGKQGRNQTYSDTAIQCCLMIKSLFRLSLGMVTGFVQSLIKLCCLDWTAPNISDIRIPPFVEDKSILILRLAIKKALMGSIYSLTPLAWSFWVKMMA